VVLSTVCEGGFLETSRWDHSDFWEHRGEKGEEEVGYGERKLL